LEQLPLVELVTLAQLVTMVLWEAPHHLAHFFMVMEVAEVEAEVIILAEAAEVVLAEHLLVQQVVIQASQAVLVARHLHHLL
jgi:hypothetical protein